MREKDAAVAVEQLCGARLRRSEVSIRNQIESLYIVESSDSDHCAGTDGPPRKKIHARCLRSGGCSLSQSPSATPTVIFILTAALNTL